MSPSSQQHAVQRVPCRHPSKSTTSTAFTEKDLEKQSEDSLNERPAVHGPEPLRSDGSLKKGTDRLPERKLTWWQGGLYMLAYNISIGILALAKAFAYLGLGGGLLFTGPYALLNYYTSMINWQLMRRYKVNCWPDILGVIFGRYAKWFGHVVQGLLQFFLMMVHVMTMRNAIVAMNAPHYVVCGVVWTFLGAGVMFVFSLHRSLKDCVWLAIVSCLSILVATAITAVSVISRSGDVTAHFVFLPNGLLSSSGSGSGMAMIVFAFTGQLVNPQICSEMANPEDFPKALRLNCIVQVIMYAVSACIIYWFGGEDVPAPALDSATGISSILAWAFALPTIVVAGVLPCMMIIKNAMRGYWSWRGMLHVPGEDSWRARGSWIAIAALLWTMAPIFAEAIPSFNGVVGIAGALLGAWISCGFPALASFRIDWDRPILYTLPTDSDGSIMPPAGTAEQGDRAVDDHTGNPWEQFWRNARRNARERPLMACSSIMIFLLGIILCVFGAYGAVSEMVRLQKTEGALRPFSCAAPTGP